MVWVKYLFTWVVILMTEIDLGYYINVFDLMRLDLPRPTKKNLDFFEDDVEIPIILVEGEDE